MDRALTQDFRFDPDDHAGYRRWRAHKLRNRIKDVSELIVEIEDLEHPTEAELAALAARIRRVNLAVYATPAPDVDKAVLRRFAHRFGLGRLDRNLCADEDAITTLSVSRTGRKGDYIPYTNRRLNWHTDGYYNPPGREIRAILMHCVQPAARGGESHLLDHELVYLRMRDENPEWVRALMAPDAMTIPANTVAGRVIRGAVTGPVFRVEPDGSLHMRYSARQRNVLWKEDPRVQEAVAWLADWWREDDPWIYHFRLMPGQGILCNNVLHARSAFEDDPAAGRMRKLYRARFHDRIRLPAGAVEEDVEHAVVE
ncbi:MAG: taurine catabolism dioxygenase TauD [Gammaproteobacteria bacterium]|nr:MAG: taurine catabolism dioxygenase TauD [Gammaproteobacteria bacterium]